MPQVIFRSAAGNNFPVDGTVYRNGVNQTFANIRSGLGNLSEPSFNEAFVWLIVSSTTNQFASLGRFISCFNTSSIPSNAIIKSVKLRLYGSQKYNALGTTPLVVVGATPSSNSSLSNGDYGQLNTTIFGEINYASFSVSGYNDINLDISSVKKEGVTALGLRLGWDAAGVFSGSWGSSRIAGYSFWTADYSDTSRDPQLVVDYELPTGNFIPFFF